MFPLVLPFLLFLNVLAGDQFHRYVDFTFIWIIKSDALAFDQAIGQLDRDPAHFFGILGNRRLHQTSCDGISCDLVAIESDNEDVFAPGFSNGIGCADSHGIISAKTATRSGCSARISFIAV